MKKPSNLEVFFSCMLGAVIAVVVLGIFILQTKWY